jgi:hypothetical protein
LKIGQIMEDSDTCFRCADPLLALLIVLVLGLLF